MIEIEFSKSRKVIKVTPSGDLYADDFDRLTQTFDQFVNEKDSIPNLVINITGFPHWDSFLAAKKHFKFVHDHHKAIKKVAIVSDNFALTTLPILVDHFVHAKVRQFKSADLKDAVKWAESAEDHPGSFRVLEDLPDHVVGLKAVGIITSQDYKETLVPLIQERLEKFDQINLLMIFDSGFSSYSGDAMWDDLRFGFSHFGDFGKIAIVSDISWLRQGVKLFGPLIRADVSVFDTDELEQAYVWIEN